MHIPGSFFRSLGRQPGALEPGVGIRGVVDDQFGDYLQIPSVRFLHEVAESGDITVRSIDIIVVGDIVAVVFVGKEG